MLLMAWECSEKIMDQIIFCDSKSSLTLEQF